MELFNEQHLVLDLEVKNQKNAFEKIADLAKELGVVDNTKELVKGFIKREQTGGTTGMTDGFAIPHTMSAKINRPAIIVCRFKNGIDWKAYDGELTKVAIALLIPEQNRSSDQVNILSSLATALMDEKFRKLVLTSSTKEPIVKTINKIIAPKKEVKETKIKTKKVETAIKKEFGSGKKLIAGVTACATGIAHTYMAKEAIDKECEKLGYVSHVETEGQNGRENLLTPEIIKKADAIIVATDINVETDRFIGKKVFFCDTNQAINKPTETIQKALESKEFHGKQVSKSPTQSGDLFATERGGFMKHFLSGVSKMIPFIVFSGIVYAIINAVAMGVWGLGSAKPQPMPEIMDILLAVAGVGFTLFIGVMGAFIAESIGGRAAIGPGFIATFVASSPSMYWFWNGVIPSEITGTVQGVDIAVGGISLSIIAALMMGFAAGYLVKWFNTFKVHKNLRAVMSILVIPVVCTSMLVFPFVFLLSGPLGYLMNGFAFGLAIGGDYTAVAFLLGFVLGFMVGFDMGGPINKIATATATALITIDPRLMGAVACAIPIAPLGCGLATLIGRKTFDENERGLGYAGLTLGFMGISEGAIPFFAKRPKQVLIANVIGSAIAGGLAFCFFVGGHIGMWGGPIDALVLGIYADPGAAGVVIPTIFGGTGTAAAQGNGMQFISILWFFVAMAAGVAIQASIFIGLIKISEGTGKVSKWKIWEILHLKNKESKDNANKFELKQREIANWRMNKLNWMFKYVK